MPPLESAMRPLGRGDVTGQLFVAVFLLAATASAQTNLGPSKCVGCHDHEKQARKWQKEEPAALKGKAHYNTLKQLDAPESAKWAKAVGLADAYDLKGSCVKCHATVFRGDANAGVSCESCHGPSSKYNDLHQQKGQYAASVAVGLVDLKEKPATIGKVCVECHVLTDRKLAAAGHPTGATFDAGASIQKLVHWDTAYNYAAITSAGKAAGKAVPAGGAPTASAPAAKAPPAKTAPAATAGATTVPSAPTKAPAATAPAPRRPAATAPPAPPPAPWDWDQPIRPLPDDYVPEPEPAAEEAAAEPEAGEAAEPEPAPAAPARRAAPLPPSLAEETPFVPELAGVSGAASVNPAVEAEAPAPPAPRTPAAEAAALRGQAVQLLDRLLRAGARTPGAPAPAKPAEYQGPDAELLRLQDEVIALALEALRRPE
jgi:hypothetical protein